ncbi:MAG: Gfo/Idh/MocA family oxidoreductase [Isosphaeraceae bacterium]|nr:Gfo/Idh/MocA family oxidoreductase [Isosphaeraceae bacterium]
MMVLIRRREFLRQVADAGVAAALTGRALAGPKSPNEKLNLAVIGTARRAAANIDEVKGENIVALCDIDDRLLGRASEKFPRAKTFNDFRKLLDAMANQIDAVVVSTADHTHAPASVAAMKLGKHVYCEKPLTHDVYEARVATETAAEQKVVTQMGTQIHAGDNYRRVVELVRSGAIGPVRAVHVWCGRSWSGGDRPKETPPVPPYLHWDLWLGPAPERPYHPTYQPQNWRRWWDFGNGTLGDMACHYMDLPFWALDLKYPLTVEAEGPPVHPETTPPWLIVRYEFPARGEQPPLKLTWYDGDKRPSLLAEKDLPRWNSAVLFVGDKGMLLADYTRHQLYPESEYRDFSPPPATIPPSIGHHAEWIAACKTGGPTTCHFGYSGPLTEAVLLGNVAYRVGQKLHWDAESLKATNCPEAERYIRREYRRGWTL